MVLFRGKQELRLQSHAKARLLHSRPEVVKNLLRFCVAIPTSLSNGLLTK